MNIAIASSAVTVIVDHARAEAPNEACGILFGGVDDMSDALRILAAEPAANVAAYPERAFEIDPAALLSAHRDARGQGRSIVGWYHSHPNGVTRPSATDAARAVEDGKLWLIAGISGGVGKAGLGAAGLGEAGLGEASPVGAGGNAYAGCTADDVTLAAWRVVSGGSVHGRFAPVTLVAD